MYYTYTFYLAPYYGLGLCFRICNCNARYCNLENSCRRLTRGPTVLRFESVQADDRSMSPSTLGSSANAVASLTRAFAREIENLPTRYLRYVTIKAFRECPSHLGVYAGNSIRSKPRMTSELYPAHVHLTSKPGTSGSRRCASSITVPC